MIELFETVKDQGKFTKEQMEILTRIENSTVELCNSITGTTEGVPVELLNEISELVRDKLLENGYITHYPAIHYREDGTPYMEEYQVKPK